MKVSTNLVMTELDNDTLQSTVFQYFVITVWMKSSYFWKVIQSLLSVYVRHFVNYTSIFCRPLWP